MITPDQVKELNTTFEAFKEVNDRILKEQKTLGDATTETKQKLDRMQDALDKWETKATATDNEYRKQEAKTKALEEYIEALEARLNRKGSFSDSTSAEEEIKATARQRKSVFAKMLRYGRSNVEEAKSMLTPEELKVLVSGNDTTGGYFAPPEVLSEVILGSIEWNALRGIVRVRQTMRPEVQVGRRLRTTAATWVAERTARSETQGPIWGWETIRAHEQYAMVPVTKQDLDDSVFDIVGFLNADFAEQFGVAEGYAFLKGTNAGQPEGIMTNASIDYTAGGHASELQADALIACYYDLREAYLANSSWLANRSTLKTIRQMKDADGQYLWAPGIRTDARPASILDRPYIICPDMDSIGAGNYPLAFGDFLRGYTVIDRMEMQQMIDPYAQKSTGTIEYSAARRVGGAVVLPEAIRKLKISVS